MVLTACSGDESTVASPDSGAATGSASARPAEPTVAGEPKSAETFRTLVARAEVEELAVFDSATSSSPTMELDRRDETSGSLVFVIEERAATADGRHRVQLPIRPNGSTGWVNASEVSVSGHDFRIEVVLGEFELTLFDADEVVLVAPIGIGTQDTPTPGGTYYIKELLQPPSPDGVYGTYAYGLSGFSNVLDDFAGGTGVIGLHGTNRPDLIGTAASHGCIRLHNDVIERLVEEVRLPLGVPVTILP